MNSIARIVPDSLRGHPDMKALLDTAQSRHFTDEEYARYLEIAPGNAHRVAAARAVMGREELVVKSTVIDIMNLYPYREFHVRAPEKCIRDVTFISIYATHTMLIDDTQWFKDKLLYWFRTILHAFSYPPLGDVSGVKNPYPEITAEAQKYKPGVQSIYDCYARLRVKYQERLQPESWALMDAPLQVALDVLSETH